VPEIQLQEDNQEDVEAFMSANGVDGAYDSNGNLTIQELVGSVTASEPSWLVVTEDGASFVADEDHNKAPVDPTQWDVDAVEE